MRQGSALLEPGPDGNQQHHGDAYPADIGLHMQLHAKHIADENPCEHAQRQQRHSEYDHPFRPPGASLIDASGRSLLDYQTAGNA